MSIQNVTRYSELVARLVGQLRQAQNFDQKEFADSLGVSPSTWSRAESGLVGLSLDQLAGAAKVLGTTPGHLLAQADHVAEHAKRRGIAVLAGREAAKDDQAFAYLGAAALGALVATILAKGK